MQNFTETQRFRQWWLWVLIAVSTLIPLSLLLTKRLHPSNLVPLTIPLLLALVMYMMRLDTQIDQVGIRYRLFPLTGWRSIPWSRIEKAEVCLHQFTSYGARWNFDVQYHVVEGQWGLLINRLNDRQLLLGTQQPEELRQFLATLHPPIAG